LKRLLLLGGGHAHVHGLAAMARAPWRDVEVVLVTPHERQMYSGMVPGVVAGHYAPQEAAIPLMPLARAAGVRWVRGAAVGLDAARRMVALADGQTLGYELLSIDTGAVMDRDAIPGAREHALFVRPIEDFVAALPALATGDKRRRIDVDGGEGRWLAAEGGEGHRIDVDGGRRRRIAVVGGGAAGFELALALAHTHGDAAQLTLVTGGSPVLAGYPAAVMARGARAVQRLGVQVRQAALVAVAPEALTLSDGSVLPCDRAVMAVGASAAPWLAGSGLALDGRGFVATGPTLQSTSHPEVFAAGDAATRQDVSHPRSGVYAVRAGPPLARNLRLVLDGVSPLAYQPQARSLNLLSCGDRTAIAAWGPLTVEGAWVWRWKDRIDRAFIRRFSLAG
jgi:selenide,water dikinase